MAFTACKLEIVHNAALHKFPRNVQQTGWGGGEEIAMKPLGSLRQIEAGRTHPPHNGISNKHDCVRLSHKQDAELYAVIA